MENFDLDWDANDRMKNFGKMRILHVLPKNLIQLTLSKIVSFARTFCDRGNPDKIAYALCLLNVGISTVNHSKENF